MLHLKSKSAPNSKTLYRTYRSSKLTTSYKEDHWWYRADSNIGLDYTGMGM